MPAIMGRPTTKRHRLARRRLRLLILALVFLSACAAASPTVVYHKRGATEASFRRDKYECKREAHSFIRPPDRSITREDLDRAVGDLRYGSTEGPGEQVARAVKEYYGDRAYQNNLEAAFNECMEIRGYRWK